MGFRIHDLQRRDNKGGGGYKRSERKSEMQREAMNRGSLPSYSPPNLFSILASLPEGNFPFR